MVAVIKLIFFGSNMLHRFGGAEESAYRILNGLTNVDILVVAGVRKDVDDKFGVYDYRNVIRVPFANNKYFLYICYFINTFRTKRVFHSIESDILFAQMRAAMAINAFNGPSAYFFRAENDLNVYRTYRKGLLRRITFLIKFLLEWPFFIFFCAENNRAVQKAKLLVANSEFLATAIKKRFNKDAVIFYPPIDIKAISDIQIPLLKEKRYIMMVGSEKVKGVEIFLKIAHMMPEHEFLLVGKSHKQEKIGNVTYHPFVQDPFKLYNTAKILLVPSILEETFGRVSVEAQAVGIPALVSNRGGLPETVPSLDYVVDDIYDIESWVNRIINILNNYEFHSRKVKEYVQKFDMYSGLEKLLKAVYETTGVKLYAKSGAEKNVDNA